MSERFSSSPVDRIGPRIAVVGVGGAGGNAVNNMIRSGLKGAIFIVCNTDAQALSQSLCPEPQRIHLGMKVTQGLGAGSSPDIGRLAAEESIEDVMAQLSDVHMLFITAGMGGGTGTGAAPIIAKAARDKGILTVGVVTKPFYFEGATRMRAAEKGIQVIKECVDTLLVIPNQNLFRVATETTTFAQAFAMADDVLFSGVRTFTDLMVKPGLVNLDFADICTVMRNMMGKAMMGTGESSSENRAIEAAEKAIGGLLLDDVMVKGARAVLINITGGEDLTLYEVDEAIGRIKQEVDQDNQKDSAHIIFGAAFDSDLKGCLRVSVVATGIDVKEPEKQQQPEKAEIPSPSVSSTGETGFHTLGSRHGDYNFDKAHFSSFALKEDEEEEEPQYVPERKRSFFERLTGLGRRKEVRSFPRNTKELEAEKDRTSEEDFKEFSGKSYGADGDTFEIPTFLRQKNRKGRTR